MKRLITSLMVIVLVGCAASALKPPAKAKITAFYTRSSTVTVRGERGSVRGAATVVVRDAQGVVAASVTAHRDGSFEAGFCAGQWARENFDCKYLGDLRPGDWISVEYTVGAAKSPAVSIEIR